MTRQTFISFFGVLAVLVIGLLPFPAFAQGNPCGGDTSLYTIVCSITMQFAWFPKAMAILCYGLGVVLTVIALLNLRAYGDDPSSIPLRSIIIKLMLGASLLSLPFAMRVVVSTVIGTDTMTDSNDNIRRPCSYSATNSLLQKRGDQAPACGASGN